MINERILNVRFFTFGVSFDVGWLLVLISTAPSGQVVVSELAGNTRSGPSLDV